MRGRKPDPGAPERGTAHVRKPLELAPPEYTEAILPSRVTSIPLPAVLPRTKDVRRMWYAMLTEVARVGLRPGDLPTIEACAIAKYRHSQAGAYVKKFGMMVRGGADGAKRNPMLQEEREQAILYDRLAQRLGLSPEARVRLNLMQIAGTTMLGTLHTKLSAVVEAELDDVIDAELSDEVDHG